MLQGSNWRVKSQNIWKFIEIPKVSLGKCHMHDVSLSGCVVCVEVYWVGQMFITKLILQKYAQQGKVTLSLAVECKLQFSNNELFDFNNEPKRFTSGNNKVELWFKLWMPWHQFTQNLWMGNTFFIWLKMISASNGFCNIQVASLFVMKFNTSSRQIKCLNLNSRVN